jgi:hypothetical protein
LTAGSERLVFPPFVGITATLGDRSKENATVDGHFRRTPPLHLLAVSVLLMALTSIPERVALAQQPEDVHSFFDCGVVETHSGSALIFYADHTRYDSAMNWGVSVWQDLDIVHFIREDQDPGLRYVDANLNGTVIGGSYYQNRLGYHDCTASPLESIIVFNAYKFDDPLFSQADALWVGAHETGHALKIGDHGSSMYSNTLMYEKYNYLTQDGIPNRPQDHDIEDY